MSANEKRIYVSFVFENGNHPIYQVNFSESLINEAKILFLELVIENICKANKISVKNVDILDERMKPISNRNQYLKTSTIYMRTLGKILFPKFVQETLHTSNSDAPLKQKEIKKEKSSGFFKNISLFKKSEEKKHLTSINDISIEITEKPFLPLLPQNNSKNDKSKKKSIISKKTDHYLFTSGNMYVKEIPDNCGCLLFSFLPIDTPHNPEYPPPLYLEFDNVDHTKGREKNDCLNGLNILSSGDLKCVDPEVIKSQKGLISELIKTLAQSIAEGRGIVGVSLPIRIFEPRSLIERIADWWSYLPIYAKRCVENTDPVFRMKNCISFYLAGLHVGISLYKPFNPILGETYQGSFIDGTTIHCEHISHHPPITNFYLVGQKYKFYGSYEYTAKTSSTYNEISMYQVGDTFIEFENGQKIQLRLPAAKIKGMMWGDKLICISGVFQAIDEKNGLKGIVGVGYAKKGDFYTKSKTSDSIFGNIYEYDNSGDQKHKKNIKAQYKEEMKMSDMKKNICEVSGSWLQNLNFGNEEFWNIDTNRPLKHTAISHPIPSDCRFREDLIWLKLKNQKFAQKWKLELEKRQRAEKKLRIDYAKKHK